MVVVKHIIQCSLWYDIQQKMGSQPRNIAEQKQYHDFLDNMNEERSRKNALGKMKDFQEGKKVRKLL